MSCLRPASAARSARLAGLLLGLLLAAWSAPAQADTVGITIGGKAGPPGWDEAMGLQVFADDAVDPDARIFDAPDYQHQLLVPGPEEDAFLLGIRDGSVRLLPASAIEWNEQKLPAPDVAKATAAGSFTSLDGVIEFEREAYWSIRPQPPLEGPVSIEQLRKEKPEYFHAASKYQPDPEAVKSLSSVRGETRIVVFFGTWCLLCKEYLPHLLKTLEAAGNPKITVEYIGTSEDHQRPADLLKKYHADATPTFLVLQGGKEVGRIVEEPDDTVERDLALILSGR